MNEEDGFDEVIETLVPERGPAERTLGWALAIASGAIGLLVLAFFGYAVGAVSS